MKTRDCDELKKMFYDYISNDLPPDDREEIEAHLPDCESCTTEMKQAEGLLKMVGDMPTPDPGDDYWANTPQNILQAYKDETREATQPSQNNLLSQWLEILTLRPALKYGFAFSIAIVFITTIIFYPVQSSLDNTSYLTQLQQPERILRYLDSQPISSLPSANLAFSSNRKTNYFLLGTLYSTSSAYLVAGNRIQSVKTLTQLKSLLPESSEINTKFSQLITLIQNPDSSKKTLFNETDELYPLLKKLARNNNTDLEMLSFGIWLNNLILAAVTDNKNEISQPELTNYFKKLPEKNILPPGIQVKIKKLISILESNKIDRQATQQILQLAQEIQALLL